MNSESIATTDHHRADSQHLGPKLKALVWEECRVGGVIAGWCLIAGLLLLVQCKLQLGSDAWSSDGFGLTVALGVPGMIGILLILNTNYSGHLSGGFSDRILHLPIATHWAVAIAMTMRLLFVLVCSLVMLSASQALFPDGPRLGAVPFLVLLYLTAQTLDWLRAPVSGLSSILTIVVALGTIFLLGDLDALVASASSGTNGILLVALAVAAVVPAYGISYMAVNNTRVGRRGGIPEIWEWPEYLSASTLSRSRPFSSPVAAQVWHDLRRSLWTVPVITALTWAIAVSAFWYYNGPARYDASVNADLWVLFAALGFPALLLASLAHGIRTRVLGFLRSRGNPGFAYLQPLSAGQFATARVLANAIVLLPTLAVTLALHFWIGGPRIITQILPDALDAGYVSFREVLWILAGRAFVAGLVAWLLMAFMTRLVYFSIAAAFILWVVIGMLVAGSVLRHAPSAMMLNLLFVLLVTAGAYSYAWRKGLLSVKSLAVWGGIFLLTRWLLEFPMATLTHSSAVSTSRIPASIMCWGLAALAPLPYIAIVLDINRRRHGTQRQQKPAPSLTRGTGGTRRPLIWALTACTVIFIIWLGWPATPAYEAWWRAQGYPVTLDELNQWYESVPDDQNRALDYLGAAKTRQDLLPEAEQRIEQVAQVSPDPYSLTVYTDQLLIAGDAELERAQPLDPADWRVTETYWDAVTSRLAPELEQIAAKPQGASRYPVDLQRFPYALELDYLADLRALARELKIDALHWAVAGNSEKATDAILAIPPLAASLNDEPILLSQLVRIAILSISSSSLEMVMNRTELEEADLERLEHAFVTDLRPEESEHAMIRALAGETAGGLYLAGSFLLLQNAPRASVVVSGQVLSYELGIPAAGERMAMTTNFRRTMDHINNPWTELSRSDLNISLPARQGAGLVAPLTAVLGSSSSSSLVSVRRAQTWITVARTAVAIERYRLAKGRLPVDLTELVPAFLPEVPMDYFADYEAPLRYHAGEDGAFVVYSVSQNGRDDGGVEMERWLANGDITFTVAPLSFRRGPQVANDEETTQNLAL